METATHSLCDVRVEGGPYKHIACSLVKGHPGGHPNEHFHSAVGWWHSGASRLQVTPGGAMRDAKVGAPANWCTLDYESVRALAETNFEGDTRYGVDNWANGLPASNLLNHALDHIFKLLAGDNTESHIGHAMWNLGKVLWMARYKPAMIDLPRVREALGMDPKPVSTGFPKGNPSEHGSRRPATVQNNWGDVLRTSEPSGTVPIVAQGSTRDDASFEPASGSSAESVDVSGFTSASPSMAKSVPIVVRCRNCGADPNTTSLLSDGCIRRQAHVWVDVAVTRSGT